MGATTDPETAVTISIMTKPIGYLDFLVLLSNSRFIMTDSGGLQEEAITLNVPCLTLRYNTERPETVTAGGNILVGSSKEKILENLRRIAGDESAYQEMSDAFNPYGDGKASKKILDAILNAYSSGKLHITAPEHIMSHVPRFCSDGNHLRKCLTDAVLMISGSDK